jgi:hypothetical protein
MLRKPPRRDRRWLSAVKALACLYSLCHSGVVSFDGGHILYEELDLEPVRASFEIYGDVLVSLAADHAAACIELIAVIENAHNVNFSGFRWFRRGAYIARDLFRTLRLTLCHGRLLFLCPLLILSPVSKEWKQLSDSTFLFRFLDL